MKGLPAAALLLVFLAAGGAADDAGLLPPDGFASGWGRHEAARVYRGAELYGHIDGGAELFLEFGFEAVTLQQYRRGEDRFVLEIYRMADPEGALGIYLMKCGPETPDPSLSERHTVGLYQLAMVKGRYYVLVTSDEGKADLRPALLEFAKFAAAGIPPASAPPVLGLLPRDRLVEGSVRLIRGPYALQSVAGSLGAGDLLQLEGKIVAVSGDYREPGGTVSSRMVVEYPAGEAASVAFRNLRDHLDPLLKVIRSGEGRLVFKDAEGKFGLAALEGRRLEIRLALPSEPPAAGEGEAADVSRPEAEPFFNYLREHFEDIHEVSMRFHLTDPSLRGRIALRMKWVEGRLAEAEVTENQTGSHQAAQAVIEALGRWHIPEMPGEVPVSTAFVIRLVGSDDPRFPGSAIVTGTVKDRQGRPIPRAEVAFSPVESPGAPPVPPARSNREGIFIRTLLTPGTWRLECRAEGYRPQAVESVALAARQHRLQPFVLEEAETPAPFPGKGAGP